MLNITAVKEMTAISPYLYKFFAFCLKKSVKIFVTKFIAPAKGHRRSILNELKCRGCIMLSAEYQLFQIIFWIIDHNLLYKLLIHNAWTCRSPNLNLARY